MKSIPVIGITGGVGAGKTTAINYLNQNYRCHIIVADQLAGTLREKGKCCYAPLVDLLGQDVLDENLEIDKLKMAQKIYSDSSLLRKVNEIIHPAVRIEIEKIITTVQSEGSVDCLLLEAALLIECGYKPILDELWYIQSSGDIRVKRLEIQRGYSEEKSRGIMNSQLQDEEYKLNCDRIIINNGNLEDYYSNLDTAMNDILSR